MGPATIGILILMMFAFVLFVLAGLARSPEPWRSNLIGWGLACWIGAEILARAFLKS